jgi:hypothetical protein
MSYAFWMTVKSYEWYIYYKNLIAKGIRRREKKKDQSQIILFIFIYIFVMQHDVVGCKDKQQIIYSSFQKPRFYQETEENRRKTKTLSNSY